MSQPENIKAQQRVGEAVNSGNLELIREVVAPNVIAPDPGPAQGPGPDGFIAFFMEFRAAFPDLKITVEYLTADEDSVEIAYTVTGTHQGELVGILPWARQ